MTGRNLLRHSSHIATSVFLVAAVLAAIVITRPAAGESPPGTHITNISVENLNGDSTVIAVSLDGPITGRRWSHIDGDEPRAVLKIAGIVEAYRPYEVAVEDERVHRVRIGHHPEFNPPEEHLVIDLIDEHVAITRVMKQDHRLIVVLQRVEASGGSQPPAPRAPTPTALVPKTVPATPTPTMTPTASATLTPTPSLTPTETTTTAPPTPPTATSPTATPASHISPEQPRATPPTMPTNQPQVARRVATIPHPPKDFSGPLLTELVVSHREDGSALVRVTTDRQIEGTSVRFFGVRSAPPRNLLVIPGMGLPGEGALLPVGDGLLCEIGVAFKDDGGQPRTELTFYLASSEVTFEQAAVKGTHAVIHLRPPADPQAPLGCNAENARRNRTWRFIAAGPPKEALVVAE